MNIIHFFLNFLLANVFASIYDLKCLYIYNLRHISILDYYNFKHLFIFIFSHYKVLYVIFAFFLPTVIPIVFWNENPICALFTAYFARAILLLNATWSVNSAAHLYGTRPFDK